MTGSVRFRPPGRAACSLATSCVVCAATSQKKKKKPRSRPSLRFCAARLGPWILRPFVAESGVERARAARALPIAVAPPRRRRYHQARPTRGLANWSSNAPSRQSSRSSSTQSRAASLEERAVVTDDDDGAVKIAQTRGQGVELACPDDSSTARRGAKHEARPTLGRPG